MHVHIKIVH